MATLNKIVEYSHYSLDLKVQGPKSILEPNIGKINNRQGPAGSLIKVKVKRMREIFKGRKWFSVISIKI